MNTPTKSKCDRTPTKATCDRTPTPMTDKLFNDYIQEPLQSIGDLAAIMHNQCERFERELTAVTEQRDGLRAGIDYASGQLTKVKEQRDRLAEALKMIATFDYDDLQCDNGHGARYVATEALQSLTTNAKP